MFIAYDKVQFSQYALYNEYALKTPSAETRWLAIDILGEASNDEIVTTLRDDLRQIILNDGYIATEYYLFAIRSANGDTFDIYLLDEDSLFVSCKADIAEADVLAEATSMVNEVSDRIKKLQAKRG